MLLKFSFNNIFNHKDESNFIVSYICVFTNKEIAVACVLKRLKSPQIRISCWDGVCTTLAKAAAIFIPASQQTKSGTSLLFCVHPVFALLPVGLRQLTAKPLLHSAQRALPPYFGSSVAGFCFRATSSHQRHTDRTVRRALWRSAALMDGVFPAYRWSAAAGNLLSGTRGCARARVALCIWMCNGLPPALIYHLYDHQAGKP